MGNVHKLKASEINPLRAALAEAISARDAAAVELKSANAALARGENMVATETAHLNAAEEALATLRSERSAEIRAAVLSGNPAPSRSEAPLLDGIQDAKVALEFATDAANEARAKLALAEYAIQKSEASVTDAIAALVEDEIGDVLKAARAAVDALMDKRNLLHFLAEQVLRDPHGHPRNRELTTTVERFIDTNPFAQSRAAWRETPQVNSWRDALMALRVDSNAAVPV